MSVSSGRSEKKGCLANKADKKKKKGMGGIENCYRR